MTPAVHAALVFVQLLFAGLAISGRYVLPHVPAGLLVTLRVLGAAGVLLSWNALRGGPWVRDRGDLLRLALLGFLGIAANQTLFLFGLKHSTAINATILVTTVPVFTVLGAVLLGREPPSPLKFAGIALAAAGAIYLIGPDRLSFARDVAFGNLLIVLGMICYASYFLLSKPLMARHDSVTVSAYVMLFAIAGVLPLGALGLRGFDWAAVSPSVWGWVVFIVIGPTILTYLLNVWALKRATPTVVAVYIYLQPLFTAAIAPLVLRGEGLTTRAALAGLLIFSGLALVIAAERQQRREMPDEAPVGE
ncbi:MAG: DMT family transporter [Gemmatimonadales bacterium]|nr:DMT family transporter [Gemmatimonadales bacterium]